MRVTIDEAALIAQIHDLSQRIQRLPPAMKRAVRPQMKAAAKLVAQTATDFAKQPPTGRSYGKRRRWKTVTVTQTSPTTGQRVRQKRRVRADDALPYRASRPDAPPGQLTGALSKSIKSRLGRRGAGEIFSRNPVAHLMELGTADRQTGGRLRRSRRGVLTFTPSAHGTYNRGRVAPRPYMAPALRKRRPIVVQLLAQALVQSVQAV